MEQQIQDLVSSIRKEGIEEASRESAAILAKANAEAERILADAKKKAAKMIEDAKSECDLVSQSSKAAISQAARDVSLSLKKSIDDQITRILSNQVASTLDKTTLAALIKEVVKAEGADVTAEISTVDADKVVEGLKADLAAELKAGLVLKAGSSSASGLKVASSDGSGYFDLSADELALLLKPYLSPALKSIIYG